MTKYLRAVPPAGWLLFLALVLRAGWALRHGNALAASVYVDQAGYQQFALSVLRSGIFGVEGVPSAGRSPLYPLFLALCYALFGENPLAARLMQAVVGVFSILGIYRLAKELFNEPAARLAAAVGAVYPFYIFYSAFLLTETLLVFFSIWSVYAFISLKNSPGLSRGLACGALWGLLILTKPTALPCALLLQILAPTVFRRWWKLPLKSAAAVALGFWVLTIPWLARNHRLLGQATWDTNGGYTAYEGIVEYANNKAGRGGTAIRAGDLWKEIKDLPETEKDSRFKKEVLSFIRNNPAQYLRQVLGNVVDFWRFFPRSGNEYSKGSGALTWISLAFEAPLILLGFFALYRFRDRWRDLLPIYLFVGNLFSVHALLLAQMRYRLPVMGLMIVLAAGVLASFEESGTPVA